LQNVWVVQKLDAAAVQRYASSVLAPEAELLASAEPVSAFNTLLYKLYSTKWQPHSEASGRPIVGRAFKESRIRLVCRIVYGPAKVPCMPRFVEQSCKQSLSADFSNA
jgi:hypothetical protein